MSFRHLRFSATLFFFLLLLPLPRNYPMAAAGGSKHEIEVVKKRGGGAADGSHGGAGGDAAAANGGGGHGRGAGGQIPAYTAGAMNHNRGHRHHGSNSATINRVGSSCFALIFFTSIPLFIV